MNVQDPEEIVNKYGQKVNEYGCKDKQRSDNEDRSSGYRNMIHKENGLYSTDVDLMCIKHISNTQFQVMAGLELTLIEDHRGRPHNNYFARIMARYRRDAQGKYSVHITKCCSAPSIIVAFSRDLMNFYLYNLTKDDNIWCYQNRLRHLEWHYQIRDINPPKKLYADNKMDSYKEKFIVEAPEWMSIS